MAGTCSVEGCGKPVKAHGLCMTHYARQRRHGDPNVVLDPPAPRECAVDGCAERAVTRDLCPKHYKRWQRTGSPLVSRPRGRPPILP